MDVFMSFVGVCSCPLPLHPPPPLSSRHVAADLFCGRWPSSSSSSFGRPLPSVSGTSSWLSLGAIRQFCDSFTQALSRFLGRDHSIHCNSTIFDYSPVRCSGSMFTRTSGVKSAADRGRTTSTASTPDIAAAVYYNVGDALALKFGGMSQWCVAYFRLRAFVCVCVFVCSLACTAVSPSTSEENRCRSRLLDTAAPSLSNAGALCVE